MDLTQSIGQLVGDFTQRTILVVLPATFIMGLSFPAASALVAGEDEEIASRAGLLLAANTFGAIVGTFVVPFLVIPLVGSPVALGLIAILNALTRHRPGVRRPDRGAPAALHDRGAGCRRHGRGGRRARRRAPLHRPERRPDRARPRDHPARDRGRDRGRPGRHDQRVQAALGHRYLDDPADRRRQAHAGPAAHPAAGLEAGADDRVRDGLGVPCLAHRGHEDRRGGARAVGPDRVRRLLPGRPGGPRQPERSGDHRRRPEPRGAHRPDATTSSWSTRRRRSRARACR